MVKISNYFVYMIEYFECRLKKIGISKHKILSIIIDSGEIIVKMAKTWLDDDENSNEAN